MTSKFHRKRRVSIGQPKKTKTQRAHFWLLTFWTVAGIPASYFMRNSITFVTILSVYAIIASHWAGWSAER